MYRKPNENIERYKMDNNESKMNLIGRRFEDFFSKLMNPHYYEGTKYAEYFSEIDEDGRSKIYVYDPFEVEIDKIMKNPHDQMKYMVGLTGMGKTTLLRNYFRIVDRDVKLTNEKIIVYISFYNVNLSGDNPQKSVENEIVTYMIRTIKVLIESNKEIVANQTEFWKEFYGFIKNNKPTLLENESLTPDSDFITDILGEVSDDRLMKQLKMLCDSKPIEYYSSFIKFLLRKIPEIKQIVMIYDDIEAKASVFHRPLVEVARHVHACFGAVDERAISVKTIVSMRAYTFRANIGRESEARREHLEHDALLKTETVNLHNIFEARFRYIEERENKNNVADSKSTIQAKKVLEYVEQQLDNMGGKIIYKLSNNNLCDAMLLYCHVLTNVEWVACDEIENKGSFIIGEKNYKLTKDNILRAIANGNSKVYFGENNKYVPNLLFNQLEGSELIGLYIIRYLKKLGISRVYGIKYAEGKEIYRDISSLFIRNNDSEARKDAWRYRILNVIEYFYYSGILFRSLCDIEDIPDKQVERKYSNEYKLYLAPRGECLYGMLSDNAVLLELYRDDIYVDLPGNDIVTDNMSSTAEVFDYLIKYVAFLFECEKRNIANASDNLNRYQELIGDEFITALLLQGIVKNIIVYFKKQGEDSFYNELMENARTIINNMIEYSQKIEEVYKVIFKVPDDLKKLISNV
jgi:hypothetical protein